MKLGRLYLIAMLVGTVGAIGCSDDDPPPVNGTGGTGGNGTGGTGGGTGGTGGGADPCTGDNCDDTMADNKALCDRAIGPCNESEDYTEAQCNELAGIICAADLSGAGGMGGMGGMGGGGGECPTAAEVCTGGFCESASSAALCTSSYDDCVNSGGSCADCEDVADFWCRGEGAG